MTLQVVLRFVPCLQPTPFPYLTTLLKDDQDGVLQHGQVDLDSQIEDDEEIVEGEDGNGIAYHDNYDSDSIISSVSYAHVYPVHKSDGIAEDALHKKEPTPKRQRSLSIPIHYKSRFTTGMPIFEPQPLPIAYGWMVKGTAEHIEDLHLSGIPFCNSEVHSKMKIEVLGEYTWIEVTPSQQQSYERFPAIYVPGNARTWRGLKIDTSLDQDDIRSITSQTIRDDNLNRQPRYPYEPTFRALESKGNATSFKGIDIVTDAETLTQLLSFIMGTSSARRVKESFRLELTSVRNTLIICPSHKPGSSQAGPPPKKVRQDPRVSVPDWAAGVLGNIGTRAARLPYSGGHYRIVRYRFGSVVLAVRVKVDFVYEHRRDSRRAGADPLRDVRPGFMPREEGDVAQVWRTTAKRQGLGTRPAGAGVASVRYVWQDPKARMRALLPQLWFSRSPFVIDCQVSYPDLLVKEVALVNSRQWYPSYERGYQNSLRRLAGLLKHLQERTREMGGNIVLIADPVQVCFVLLKPVINKPALPEELVLKFWGPDTEKEERGRQADMARDSTPEQDQSDLTDLSDTPSLPPGSDMANVRPSPPDKSQANPEGTSSGIAGGTPTRAERQLAEGIDPVQMVRDWNESIDNPVQQSVESDGAGDERDNEDDAQYDADASLDGYRSSSPQDSVMVGESAHEPACDMVGESPHELRVEGADAMLNSLALQMNTGGTTQEGDDRMTAVARSGGTEVLQGQHSLLMADRHLTEGMHTSDDDGEWPPRPRTELHGRITNAVPDTGQGAASHDAEARGQDHQSSRPTTPFDPNPPTPRGPSDYEMDQDGNIARRFQGNRETMMADPSDEDAAPAPRRVARPPPWRRGFTASGRPALSEPNSAWRRRFRAESSPDDDSQATESQGGEDDTVDATSNGATSQENGQEDGQEGQDS
ncbi:hypothetical protein FJTKL_04082 [Diaporthe vaccinii]|uniref:Arrestin C-terminal-like domain-containing protein n=1 Tax=Diaporthe vaccinii TaxID=105482 RepID=A0ABR4DTR7_9PEZI